MSQSQRLDEISAELGRVIQYYFETKNEETRLYRNQEVPEEGLYVTGWIVSAEYTSASLEQNGLGSGGPILPDGQSIATSMGLFELGKRWFG